MAVTKKRPKLYLVVNLGLRSVRAIVFDERGQIEYKNWFPVKTIIDGERVEQNPSEWWELTTQLLHEIKSADNSILENLISITVTSSACCLVMLDKNGNPLDNSYIVSDKRSVNEAQELTNNSALKQLFKNPNFLPVPSFMFPKIIWVKRNRPDIFKKVNFFMSSNDYLLFKLTGKSITDPLNAEKFYYDKIHGYPKELISSLGLTGKELPRVKQIGTSIGPLLPYLCKQFGIPSTTKVVLSTYDAICAFLGSGALSDGLACNVTGTVSSIRVFTQKKPKVNGGILSQSFQDFTIVGGSNNMDGGLLEWSKSMFYGDAYPDQYIYTIMESESQLSDVGSKGIIFLPYIVGERVPFFDPTVRGVFFGLERFHKRSDIIRSILEASGFMAKDLINHIEKHGVNVAEIRISGGMAQNQTLCEIRADITGKPVRVINEVEITSLGAFFIQLLQDKEINNIKSAKRFISDGVLFKPNKQNNIRYNHLFQLFKELYKTSKPLMEERKAVMTRLKMNSEHTLENL